MHLKKSVVPEVGVIMAHNLFRATSFIVGTTAHTAFKDAPSGVDSVLKRLIFIQNMCLVFGKPKMFDKNHSYSLASPVRNWLQVIFVPGNNNFLQSNIHQLVVSVQQSVTRTRSLLHGRVTVEKSPRKTATTLQSQCTCDLWKLPMHWTRSPTQARWIIDGLSFVCPRSDLTHVCTSLLRASYAIYFGILSFSIYVLCCWWSNLPRRPC